jgi:hypothetical protein
VFNKVLALSGFLLLIFSSVITFWKNDRGGWKKSLYEEKDLIGFVSLVLIIMHVFISIIILKPEYYEKFFGMDGKFNLTGELSMFFGVTGLAMMWMVNRFFSIFGVVNPQKKPRKQFKKLINIAIIAGFLHTCIMGIKSWFSPWDWHGFLPPITLLASLGFLWWLSVMLFNLSRLTRINRDGDKSRYVT